MFHWGVLGLLSLLNFVYLIVYIASNAKSLHSIDPKLQEASVEFGAAVSIIWWLASLEVLGCSLLVLVRSRSAHGTLVGIPKLPQCWIFANNPPPLGCTDYLVHRRLCILCWHIDQSRY